MECRPLLLPIVVAPPVLNTLLLPIVVVAPPVLVKPKNKGLPFFTVIRVFEEDKVQSKLLEVFESLVKTYRAWVCGRVEEGYWRGYGVDL